MSERKICEICGVEHEKRDMFQYDGNWYCENCFDDNFAMCARCGDYEPIDEMEYAECVDGFLCDYCLDHYYFVCDDCGEIVSLYDGNWLGNDHLCSDCFDRNAYYCDSCDSYVPEDEWDCERQCCTECASRVIGGYHSHVYYKVGELNFTTNEFHKGVELEIENAKQEIDNDDMALTLRDTYEHLVFEHDGSLDYGFEIITQPHTFELFKKIPWETILNLCSSNGFRSHDTNTCGLHIHYSWNFFGTQIEEQNDNVGKVIAFYERHIDDILKLSRRTWGQYQRWAAGYDTEGNIEKCKECAKKNNDRYRYINLSNNKTVEFRLGRGTLNYVSFMAWNDVHDCLVKNVKNVSYEDIDNMAVWFNGIKADTIRYMISRNCFAEVVKMYRDMEV